jgi:hypothetical protein
MLVYYREIFMYKYNKMLLLLICIVLVLLYLVPTYPKPVVIREFLSDEEREYIIHEATDKLEPSSISIHGNVDTSYRKSDTAWLSLEDPIIHEIANRCIQNTDRPLRNCEKLQVVRYSEGGHYHPHQDALDGLENQRMYTFILALTDDYEGGETEFPNLQKSYRLRAGDALFFETLNNYEMKTPKALHGGKPVKSGEKWICNLWVRKHPIPHA